ncbi:hypothetical protein GCM10010234_18180 [Streptomyces hawaiiensis]
MIWYTPNWSAATGRPAALDIDWDMLSTPRPCVRITTPVEARKAPPPAERAPRKQVRNAWIWAELIDRLVGVGREVKRLAARCTPFGHSWQPTGRPA